VEDAIRAEGLPLLPLFDLVLARNCQLMVREDNEATIKMIRSGKFAAMRHVGRTHRVNLAWLHEVIDDEQVSMEYVATDQQAADIFTQTLCNSENGGRACSLINHISSYGMVRTCSSSERRRSHTATFSVASTLCTRKAPPNWTWPC
jgi:hypothetical protein